MVSAVTLALLMDHNGIKSMGSSDDLAWWLREAWFVSWSRGSQLEPNDGGLGPDPAVSLVPRPVSQAEEHSSADPGLACPATSHHNHP